MISIRKKNSYVKRSEGELRAAEREKSRYLMADLRNYTFCHKQLHTPFPNRRRVVFLPRKTFPVDIP